MSKTKAIITISCHKKQIKLKMSIKLKDIDTTRHMYYFFNDIINMKNLDPNKIKIEKSHIKTFLFTTLNIWQSKIQNM